MYTSPTRVYLTAERDRAVLEGDPAARSLLVGAGCQIEEREATRWGLRELVGAAAQTAASALPASALLASALPLAFVEVNGTVEEIDLVATIDDLASDLAEREEELVAARARIEELSAALGEAGGRLAAANELLAAQATRIVELEGAAASSPATTSAPAAGGEQPATGGRPPAEAEGKAVERPPRDKAIKGPRETK